MFDNDPLARWEAWAIRIAIFVLLLLGLAKLVITEASALVK
jgi:hypothetical protein